MCEKLPQCCKGVTAAMTIVAKFYRLLFGKKCLSFNSNMEQTQPPITIGCCGFAEAQDKYFAEFPAIEIQQTFYQPPAVATARRWRETAPAGFCHQGLVTVGAMHSRSLFPVLTQSWPKRSGLVAD